MTEDQFQRLLEQNNAHLLRRFDEQVEQNNAALFGQLSRYFDTRFDALRDEVRQETDRIYTAVDGIAKRLVVDEQERAALIAAQDRQDGWIGQLARTTNTTLIPEQ